jgi:hypothetical protein
VVGDHHLDVVGEHERDAFLRHVSPVDQRVREPVGLPVQLGPRQRGGVGDDGELVAASYRVLPQEVLDAHGGSESKVNRVPRRGRW